jgi:hypothetical protein
MAEQSMFWPTTGTGDGISGGYTDARLKTIWKAALGNGVLQYLNNLAATGTGTSTLAVNTGAALVEGYLYENDTSASIATASLGSATYGLYVIANEDASSITVSRSVAGTTIGAKTTRLALNSTTPTQPYIKIATVVTSGGSITSITAENNRYATSRLKTSGTSTLATGTRAANQSIANTSEVTVTYGSATDSIYATVNTSTGNFTILESGTYLISSRFAFTYNATGSRSMFYIVNGSVVAVSSIEFAATGLGNVISQSRNLMHYIVSLNAGDTIAFGVYQNSGGALNLEVARTALARLG